RTSRRQRDTRAELAEVERRRAAHRKSLQGRLANEVLETGNQIKTEDLSVRAWQRIWGRSIGHKAPGMFLEILERKALASGGSFEAVPTRTTYLSSRCLCGKRE